MATETIKQMETAGTQTGSTEMMQGEVLDLSRFLFDIYGPAYKAEDETIVSATIRTIKQLRAEIFELKGKTKKS